MAKSTQAELRAAAEQAQRESWPYTDPRANYDVANTTRQNRAEGRERRG
jgi:hypothetical protein